MSAAWWEGVYDAIDAGRVAGAVLRLQSCPYRAGSQAAGACAQAAQALDEWVRAGLPPDPRPRRVLAAAALTAALTEGHATPERARAEGERARSKFYDVGDA